MKIIYRIVIVLCPSEPKIINEKYVYHDLEKDRLEDQRIYLGGDIRMQAAVQLAEQVKYFIVVGGSKSKVDGMKNFLIQEFKKEKNTNIPDIIRIESDPDTLGNMRAIKKSDAKLTGNVGILTNFYHLPRSLRISKEVFPNLTFTPLAAESLLYFRQPTFSLFAKEFLFRVSKEINGLADLENGSYKDQHKIDEAKWKFECYDKKLLNKLNRNKKINEK